MRRRPLLIVPLLAAVLSLPALRNGLCWDDVEFTFARGGRLLTAGLTGDLLAEASPGHGPAGYYRPVAVATLLGTERLWPGPAGHHTVSVGLHALAAWLLALLLASRLERREAPSAGAPSATVLVPALAGALLWALHPGNVEPAAWISGRYDLLTGLFAAAVLLLPWRAGIGHAALIGLLMLGGLLSKEGFVAVAGVVVVDDLASGRSATVAWPRWLATSATVAAWFALRGAFSVPALPLPPLPDLPRDLLAGLATYLGRAAWPWPLTVSHPYHPTWPLAAAGTAALLALAALAWRRRELATPVALVLLPLAPMSLAAARLSEAPERYLYLPSLGLGWLAAAGLRWLWGRAGAPRAAAGAGVAVALAVFGVSWWLRLPDWRDDAALFEAALRVDPGDALGQLALGALASREGRLDEATRRLTAALARDPGSVRAASSLAAVHLRRGEVPAALDRARQAVALAPSYPLARLQLSGALHLAGDHPGELSAAEAALALSPGWREARLTRTFARCEVTPVPACEADLDALERGGGLSPADALVARTEAAIRRRDPAAARERLERLAGTAPGDPRLRLLSPAVERLAEKVRRQGGLQ